MIRTVPTGALPSIIFCQDEDLGKIAILNGERARCVTFNLGILTAVACQLRLVVQKYFVETNAAVLALPIAKVNLPAFITSCIRLAIIGIILII